MSTRIRTSRCVRRIVIVVALTVSAALSGVPAHPSAVVRAAPKTGVQYGKAWQTGSLPKAVSKKAVDTVVNAALGSKSNRERVRSVLIVKSDASGDKIVY
ncbi:MAG: hypothetical protein ACKO8T_03825, partial [Actinomycetota bacterium]